MGMTATTPDLARALSPSIDPNPSPVRHALLPSPLGDLTLVADRSELTGVYFAQHRPRPPQLAPGGRLDLDAAAPDDVLALTAAQLTEYLAGRRTSFELPTSVGGDDFQRQVWTLLGQIPYGTTTTYGAIASRLGDRALAQRVGQAVGRNPLSIVVPCHRVIGSDGWLTGYAGGLDRKRWLLDLEQPAEVRASRLF
jgi:methylated-DNA-[protein]-cysteine S-methyltransferase